MSPPNYNHNHLYWIGGSPCGGKSTVAKIIAKKCALRLYSIDEELPRLMQSIDPENQPALSAWETQTWEQRWMQPVDQLLSITIDAYDEVFRLCLNEIQSTPLSQPIIIEGNPLRPDLVMPHLAAPHHAIWLIAGAEGLRNYYSRRQWAQQIVEETHDPEKAFQNWMERDIAFANLIRQSCEANQMKYLMSDSELPLEMKAHQVASHFKLPCDL